MSRPAIRVLVAALVAQLVAHAMACGMTEAPPDAPLPTCAALGCAVALCSSHDGPCACNGTACAPRASAVDAGVDGTP